MNKHTKPTCVACKRAEQLFFVHVSKTFNLPKPQRVAQNSNLNVSVETREIPSSAGVSNAMLTRPKKLKQLFIPFPAERVLRALRDFTLSNARRFYSSMGNTLDGKGLTMSKTMSPLTPSRPNECPGHLKILLCLTPDDFTRQWGTPWTGKG